MSAAGKKPTKQAADKPQAKRAAQKPAPAADFTPTPAPSSPPPARGASFVLPSGPYEVSAELTAIILKPESEAYFQGEEKTRPQPEPVNESEFVRPKK